MADVLKTDSKKVNIPDVVVDFSGWDRALAEVEKGVAEAIRDLAFTALEHVQENITANEQIDTGAMKASAFVHIGGSGENGREEAESRARQAIAGPGAKTKGGREFETLPVVWVPDNELEAKVAVSASYAGPQESRIAFLAPAADAIREIASEVARVRINEALGR